MGKRFDEKTLENVAAANDIAEVISAYLPLKREGKNYSALCPFHKEKTPSFKVFPDTQRYKCFGCGKSGNVFMFVMEMEKIGFVEAVEHLARRAGIRLEESAGGGGGGAARCLEANLTAQEYFRKAIRSPSGKPARDYLVGRGFDGALSALFGLGYSPPEWQGLMGFAASKGVSEDALVEAGLAVRSERGRAYDRFRNRLMFPIRDARGRITGFGARTLGEDKPKYLNSPETPVFSKSRQLFGLFLAREAITSSGTAVLMEGYTDVLAARQAGVENCCATLGTALTREHLRVLKRFAREAVLVFDGDEAGKKAAERSLPIFISEEMEARIAVLPGGMDPFDFIRERGGEAFERAVSEARPLFRFLFESMGSSLDLEDPFQRAEAAERLAAIIARVPDELKREIWLTEAARFLRVGEDALRVKVRDAATAARLSERGETPRARPPMREKLGSPEWVIIGSLVAHPELMEEMSARLEGLEAESPAAAEVLGRFSQLAHKGPEWCTLFWQTLEDERLFGLVEKARELAPDEEAGAREALEGALKALEGRKLKREIERIKREMVEAEAEGDEWRLRHLTDELSQKRAQLARTRR